jgi:hypothetical protein
VLTAKIISRVRGVLRILWAEISKQFNDETIESEAHVAALLKLSTSSTVLFKKSQGSPQGYVLAQSTMHQIELKI